MKVSELLPLEVYPFTLIRLSFRNFIQRTLMMLYLSHVIDVLTKFSFMYVYMLKVSHEP